VLELTDKVILPWFQGQQQEQQQQQQQEQQAEQPTPTLRALLDAYEDAVVARTRPTVLASRQAALDAHCWGRITDKSPLLTRRGMKIEFDEGSMWAW
jgi:hypothetical protein